MISTGPKSLEMALVPPARGGLAQKVNKRVDVAISEPEAVATGQRFNLRIVA